MTSAAVIIQALALRLGRFQLGPLDLTVPRGAVLAVLGNNGAGKTTLLKLMMGLGRPDSGTINLLGYEHQKNSPAIKARTAYIGPDLDFSAWQTIGRALTFLSGFYPDWNEERCTQLLEEFRLSRRNDISTLSSGEHMKFLLVSAFSRTPELLLLDEPTANLDPGAKYILAREIRRFMTDENQTAVISSHETSYVERLADQIAILHQGKILTTARLDLVTERYLQIDVARSIGQSLPQDDGLILSEVGEDWWRFLLDQNVSRVEGLMHLRIMHPTKVALEDIFVALTQTQSH